MPKAYSYIRFSTPEQAKGRSKIRQFEACQKFCAENNLDLAIESEYTFFDSGLSAFKAAHLEDGGQFKRFLDLVKDGTISKGSFLVVESLDRLSREHVNKALRQFMDILDSEINIATLSDGKVYRKGYNTMDLMMSLVIMSRAHEESAMKAKRLGDAWQSKQIKARSENKPLGNTAPTWLQYSAQTGYSLIPEHAETVALIFKLTIEGFGMVRVCEYLNNANKPTFKKGVLWGNSSLKKVLCNKSTYGTYQPHSIKSGTRITVGEPIPNYYPAAISEETFYQAQVATAGRKIARATKQSKSFNVWQGIAKCSECQSAMHVFDKGNKIQKYMQCSTARKGACKAKAIRLDASELVYREVLAKVDSLALVQDSSAKITAQLAVIDQRLFDEESQLSELKAALGNRFSATLTDLVFTREEAIANFRTERDKLAGLLAVEQVTDKADFFSKLDLVSYEGRARSNALLKRLGIKVHICRMVDHITHTVTKHEEELGCFCVSKALGIQYISHNLDQITKAKMQDVDGALFTFYLNLMNEQFQTNMDDATLLAQLKERFYSVHPDGNIASFFMEAMQAFVAASATIEK